MNVTVTIFIADIVGSTTHASLYFPPHTYVTAPLPGFPDSAGDPREDEARYGKVHGHSVTVRHFTIPCMQPLVLGLFRDFQEWWWEDGRDSYANLASPPAGPDASVKAVAAALRHAKAYTFAKLPSNVGQASSLYNYLPRLEQAIGKINRELQQQANALQTPPHRRGMTYQVWDREDWIKNSRVTFGARKEQIAQIDQLYQSFKSEYGTESEEELECAMAIFSLALEHMTLKPQSDRHAAVLELARQLFDHYFKDDMLAH